MRIRFYRSYVLIGLMLALALNYLAPTRAEEGLRPPAAESLTTSLPPPGGQSDHDEAAGTVSAPEKPSSHSALIDDLLAGLMLILIGAKLSGELFQRLGQPAVLGELLFGILLGNLKLAGIHTADHLLSNEAVRGLSELGVILLLFEVGLESNLAEMRRVGTSSLLVAVVGVVAPSALGFAASMVFLPEEPWLVHLFVGTALSATSVGITARVLKDLNQVDRPESRIVLGAAVIDDVMGLVVLAVVSGLISATAGGTSLSIADVGLIVLKAMAFLIGAIILGRSLAPWLLRLASYLHVQQMLLVTSLGLCFLLARLASEIQLAPIVGAFAAGLILDPLHYKAFTDRGEIGIEQLIKPISGFLVPVFFVVTGMNVDLTALQAPGVLTFAGVLTLAALAGKQACALGVLEPGLSRLAVGIGMIPRGEVGLIFANIGLSLRVPGPSGLMEPVLGGGTYSAIIIVVMVTTLVTPPLLKWSMLKDPLDAPRQI